MAINNNIYFNAAVSGFVSAAISGRQITSASSSDAEYVAIVAAASAFATELDSLIPFDALVSTGASNTQLAITTNTIAANEQWRAGSLRDIVFAYFDGRYTRVATASDYATAAAACKALWTATLTALVTP